MNTIPQKTEGRPLVVGANHRTSSMLLRDRLFVEEHDMPGVLDALGGHGIAELLLLSTCDRVEVQAVVAADVEEAAIVARILGVLAKHGETPPDELDGQTYAYWDADAVRQIFAVSASLDSLVIGEPQAGARNTITGRLHNGEAGPQRDRHWQAPGFNCRRRHPSGR